MEECILSSMYFRREYGPFSWSGSIILYLKEVFSFWFCLECEQIVSPSVFSTYCCSDLFKLLSIIWNPFFKKKGSNIQHIWLCFVWNRKNVLVVCSRKLKCEFSLKFGTTKRDPCNTCRNLSTLFLSSKKIEENNKMFARIDCFDDSVVTVCVN